MPIGLLDLRGRLDEDRGVDARGVEIRRDILGQEVAPVGLVVGDRAVVEAARGPPVVQVGVDPHRC
jgi:hypothetical protein